jgi:pimeloyl-ACP methyl ester carboxylesterase
MKIRSVLRLAVAGLAVAAISVGLWQLEAAEAGLSVVPGRVGVIPVTTFAPAASGPAPVVVVAHGFAGSQQLMLPFAVTLARNGFRVVTFDFPGHGRNPAPLRGGLADDKARGAVLMQALDAVVGFAHGLPGGEQVALLGHSMASDIVVGYARAHPDIQATVAVSLFSPSVTATSPRNLLIIAGALEPGMIRDEGLRIVRLTSGDTAQQRVTYGRFEDGTARRSTLSGGVEHIGVLFSRQSLDETLAWLNQAFGRQGGDGWIDARGPWLGLLYLGLVALAWPLSGLLPRVAASPLGAGLGWRTLLPLAVLPALLTPLVLWRLPTDFLPSLLGDYLTVHYAVYGLLTAAGLWLVRRRIIMEGERLKSPLPPGEGWVRGAARAVVSGLYSPHPDPLPGGEGAVRLGSFLAATVLVAGYCILAIGLPIDRYVTSFMLPPGRAPIMLAVLVGTLIFSAADEWLTRGPGARRGAYALTKACFVLSLVLAIALNPPRLFFLIIIVPVILLFLVVYGLFSGWAYRRTGHPLVGAVAIALAFAWAIAATFPVVG